MKNNAIFITGTDTGVGKTLVTGLTARYFLEKGLSVVTQKWVQTGSKALEGDILEHFDLMDRKMADYGDFLRYMVPYSFDLAASPHLASRVGNKSVEKDKIKKAFFQLKNNFDLVIVEGSGGLMVPIDEKNLLIDICEEEKIPVLIVANNRLGAINQTLLTVEALKNRNMEIMGIVYNQLKEEENDLVIGDNPLIIEKLTGVNTLACMPHSEDLGTLYGTYRAAGDDILKELNL